MKKVFRKVALVAAVVAAGAAPMSANADALGMADLAIVNLFLVDSLTGAPVTTGLTILGTSNTGTANSDYNGVGGSGVGFGNITLPGDVDVKYRLAGAGSGAILGAYGGVLENNATSHISTTIANYGLGDMFIAGSAIGVGGTRGLTRANASAMGPTNFGGGNATIQNSAQVQTTFAVGVTQTVNFVLDYDVFVKTMVTLVGGEHASAAASTNWSMNITDDTTGDEDFFAWNPSELRRNFSTFTDAPLQQHEYAAIGTLLSVSKVIEAGHTYSLTVSQNSNASVRDIPEPGSLALLGLGLLGLAAARRRAVK